MNDPVKHCKLYKEIGCSHVDGMLCDFPKCSMLKDYEESKMKYILFINTPDNDEELEEYHTSLESLQKRKDQIYSMPWLTTDGLDVYSSDLDGNEVYLK